MGRFWLVIFGDNLGLFDQRIFSPASVGSMAPTSIMARPNPFWAVNRSRVEGVANFKKPPRSDPWV